MEKGDIVAFISYSRVDSVSSNGKSATFTDLDTGNRFEAQGEQLLEKAISADEVVKSEVISRTALVDRLSKVGDKPFTAKFKKVDGTTRVIRGVLANFENHFGRSTVIDLDLPSTDSRLRQVDHRTISELVVEGVCYKVNG